MKALSASERLSSLLRRPKNHSDYTEDEDSLHPSPCRNLSDSRDPSPSRTLSLAKAQQLEREAWDLAPKLFQGLVSEDRVVLMEVACEPERTCRPVECL